jgi:hypothetical protein
MISVHDNNVFAIDIRCEEKVIVLHTEFREGTPPEYVDVVFSGVVAHHFNHVLDGNILFDTTEETPQTFYEENKKYLREFRRYGLPINCDDSKAFVEQIIQQNLRIFEINPSYGLFGWVIAAKMEYVESNAGPDKA